MSFNDYDMCPHCGSMNTQNLDKHERGFCSSCERSWKWDDYEEIAEENDIPHAEEQPG